MICWRENNIFAGGQNHRTLPFYTRQKYVITVRVIIIISTTETKEQNQFSSFSISLTLTKPLLFLYSLYQPHSRKKMAQPWTFAVSVPKVIYWNNQAN